MIDVRAAVALDQTLRDRELELAAMVGGARFGLGFYDGSSILRSPNDTIASSYTWTYFDEIVDAMFDVGGAVLCNGGTDFPRWATMRASLPGAPASWEEPNRPPVVSWPYWMAAHNACMLRMQNKVAASVRPVRAYFQICNEAGRGGAGGPWKDPGAPYTYNTQFNSLAEGQWEFASDCVSPDGRGVMDMLEYWADNYVRQADVKIVGPCLETDVTTSAFSAELSSLISNIDPGLILAIDHPALNFYLGSKSQYLTMSKSRYVDTYYDGVMSAIDDIHDALVAASKYDYFTTEEQWDTRRWALTEMGSTLAKMNWTSTTLPGYGFFRKCEYDIAVMERLDSSGRFEVISNYVSRDRGAAEAESAQFGVMAYNGDYKSGWRAWAGPCWGN